MLNSLTYLIHLADTIAVPEPPKEKADDVDDAWEENFGTHQ